MLAELGQAGGRNEQTVALVGKLSYFPPPRLTRRQFFHSRPREKMAANAQDSNFLTRRGVVAAAIVALHVLAAWGFASGLATRAIQALAPPLEADIVEEVKKDDEPPPPPPPEIERPPVEVPPPEVTIDVPMETTTAIADVTDKPIPLPPPPPKTVGPAGEDDPSREPG